MPSEPIVMRSLLFISPLIAVCVAMNLGGVCRAGEPLKSGLQAGETINSIFEPLNVTGPSAGEPHCLVCENGAAPVVMIFAREPSAKLASLLARVDAATEKNKAAQMGSFCVFLSEKEELAERLKTTAAENKLKQIVLAIDAPAGPEGFNVAAEADVTVVLYHEHRVLANHAFRHGELDDGAIDKIMADVPKILPTK
jgi:hypothetical protein